MSIDVFAEHSPDVTDPRQSAKVIYPLYDVLFLFNWGVITGYEGWDNIEDFGHSRLNWLQGLGLFSQT